MSIDIHLSVQFIYYLVAMSGSRQGIRLDIFTIHMVHFELSAVTTINRYLPSHQIMVV